MPVDGFLTSHITNRAASSSTLIPPNQIEGTWVERKCAEKGCKQILGHWSKNGSWKYPGAKCDKHSKGGKN